MTAVVVDPVFDQYRPSHTDVTINEMESCIIWIPSSTLNDDVHVATVSHAGISQLLANMVTSNAYECGAAGQNRNGKYSQIEVSTVYSLLGPNVNEHKRDICALYRGSDIIFAMSLKTE